MNSTLERALKQARQEVKAGRDPRNAVFVMTKDEKDELDLILHFLMREFTYDATRPCDRIAGMEVKIEG